MPPQPSGGVESLADAPGLRGALNGDGNASASQPALGQAISRTDRATPCPAVGHL